MIISQVRIQNIMINYINSTSQFHQLNPISTKSPKQVNTSPRNFNFSKFSKLIKLNHQDQVYNILEQKPIDQFQKIWLESSKTSILHRSKNLPKNHELMHETWKKMQKEGYKGLTSLGRGKPCKKNGGKRQKIEIEPWPSRMEREKLKNFLKKCLTQLKISF